MSSKIYHWQCEFCGAIANTDIYSVRKRCHGSFRGEKCNAFMKQIDDEQLATHRSAVLKRLREYERAVV